MHETGEVTERGEYKFAFEDLNISKRYIEGRLHILVFFRIAGKAKEYLALFRNKQGTDPWDQDGLFLGGWCSPEVVRHPEHFSSINLTDSVVYPAYTLGLSEDKVVFIGNVHSVKPPETVIPSEVWLQTVDSLFVGDIYALYLAGRANYILARTLANREIRALGRNRTIISDKCYGEMIQSRSEIMDGIPDNQANNVIDFGDLLNHVIGMCRLRIMLGPKFADICFEKDVPPYLHVTDVAVGPVDL